MKNALHLHFSESKPLFSDRILEITLAALSALAPYAIAGLALFAYHEQFGL